MATCTSCNGRGGFWRPNSSGTQDFFTCAPCGGKGHLPDPGRGGPNPGGIDLTALRNIDPKTLRKTVIVVLAALFVVFFVLPGVMSLILLWPLWCVLLQICR